MWNILANDGLAPEGVKKLTGLGYTVDTQHQDLESLKSNINNYDVLIVRSATKVRKELIDTMTRVKLIIRAGVGLDNIDVAYAEEKGIQVNNTPTASSRSVAELAFGHMMGLYRYIHLANREMPQKGNTEFKALKKAYSKGHEVQGKRLGIIGLGRIGKELANLAYGAGMDVIAHDPWTEDNSIRIKIASQALQVHVPLVNMEEIFKLSDVISIHVPRADEPIINSETISKCRDGVVIINTSRGECIDEPALLEGLDSGKVGGAALDVFNNEPTPDQRLMEHDRISVTPHIGASTQQAQNKIAQVIIDLIEKAHKSA